MVADDTRDASFDQDADLVSVVIPAYNSSRYIAQALATVLAQDHPAIEIIVVDDGSTDDTCQIVARDFPTVRLLTQCNKGAGAARNLGIAGARGKYVAFLDADDAWWPRKLSTQLAALRGSVFRMAYGRFVWWRPDDNGRWVEPSVVFERIDPRDVSTGPVVSGSPYAELLLDCIVWTSTVMVERAALEQVGLFDPALRKGQDYDLWLRLSREIPMVGIEQPMALYRIHPESITATLNVENYHYLILSRALARWGESGPDGRRPAAGEVSRVLARSCLDHGRAHLERGDPWVALESIRRSIQHSGFDLKAALMWLAALGLCGFAWLRGRAT